MIIHYAISGKTAAAIIAERANAEKPNMGLQTFRNAPHGKIQRTDIGIAKNYLIEKDSSLFLLLIPNLYLFLLAIICELCPKSITAAGMSRFWRVLTNFYHECYHQTYYRRQ